jgi:hypothetical protein
MHLENKGRNASSLDAQLTEITLLLYLLPQSRGPWYPPGAGRGYVVDGRVVSSAVTPIDIDRVDQIVEPRQDRQGTFWYVPRLIKPHRPDQSHRIARVDDKFLSLCKFQLDLLLVFYATESSRLLCRWLYFIQDFQSSYRCWAFVWFGAVPISLSMPMGDLGPTSASRSF